MLCNCTFELADNRARIILIKLISHYSQAPDWSMGLFFHNKKEENIRRYDKKKQKTDSLSNKILYLVVEK